MGELAISEIDEGNYSLFFLIGIESGFLLQFFEISLIKLGSKWVEGFIAENFHIVVFRFDIDQNNKPDAYQSLSFDPIVKPIRRNPDSRLKNILNLPKHIMWENLEEQRLSILIQ